MSNDKYFLVDNVFAAMYDDAREKQNDQSDELPNSGTAKQAQEEQGGCIYVKDGQEGRVSDSS